MRGGSAARHGSGPGACRQAALWRALWQIPARPARLPQPLRAPQYHTAAVTALRFAPRSQLLASAARDGTLALWPVYAQPRE